ncbi:RNA polymerase sigma factor [Hydrogenophaga soli]
MSVPRSDARILGPVARVVEATVRRSSRRLVALLAVRTRDVAAAEDALSGAVLKALQTWTDASLPDNPEAWLLTVARRQVLDAQRHDQVCTEAEATLLTLAPTPSDPGMGQASFVDERIKLLFVCAHPAIDASMRTPLMLQVVLGVDVAQMAAVFLTSPAALAQRLVRAKARIRDSGMVFEVPPAAALPERLPPVLDAIYAAFACGWDALPTDEPGPSLETQALELAAMVSATLPHQAEAAGLWALLLCIHARAPARWGASGDRFVPLNEQDVQRWDTALLTQADRVLRHAASLGTLGRYQLEAAIQQTHVHLRLQGRSSSPELLALYEGLAVVAPSVGATLAHWAAVADQEGAAKALARMEASGLSSRLVSHQPYWALQAELLRRLHRPAQARQAYERAMALSADARVRAYLEARSQG